MEIKKLLEELKKAEAVTDELDARFDEGDESEELDELWDAAYKKEHECFDRVVNELIRLIGVDAAVASKMMLMKRNEIESLVARLA